MSTTAQRTGAVQAVRRFNRWYTNQLGLLSRYRFDTRLTLTEARIIFEIGRPGQHTQSALRRDLSIDMGYMSRIVKRLAAAGLVSAHRDEQDSRVLLLELTGAGRRALTRINAASDAQVEDMLRGMSNTEALSVVEHLRAAEALLARSAGRGPRIEKVRGPADVAAARALMREYAQFLGEDLSFQGFEEELASLPGKYIPPSGALLLAWVPREASPAGRAKPGGSRRPGRGGSSLVPAGCVAMRKLSPRICEMKRLFVRPAYRGLGLGRILAERVIEEARALGYTKMRLDTLDRLESAVALYQRLGFVRIPAYYVNPIPGVMYWEKALDPIRPGH